MSTSYNLPTKFQLHRFINNGDLLSDRNPAEKTNTQTESDTLPIYNRGSSENE